jgi:hypothetical protein
MQIHELTRPQQTNEAISLSNIKSAAGKIGNQVKSAAGKMGDRIAQNPVASALAQSMNRNLGTNIGGAAAGASVAPGYAQQAATGVTAPLIKKIAQDKAQMWDQTLAAAMNNEKTTDPGQLDSNNLTAIATKMINNDLTALGNNYKRLETSVDPASMGGKGQQMARDIVARIDKGIVELVNSVKDPNNTAKILKDVNQKNWQELAGLMHTATSMAQFQRNASTKASAAAPAADPQLNAAMQAMGVDAAGLMKLNAEVKQSGQKLNITSTGSPMVDSLLKAAKLL